jgi:hypothetical protein
MNWEWFSMGRMKLGIAVGGVAFVLLGVVAAVTMRSDSSPSRTQPVASESQGGTPTSIGATASAASATTPTTKAPGAPTTTKAPSKATASAVTPPSVPRSPEEVQQFITALRQQLQASAATVANGSTAPVTKEQIEAQLLAQLKQLGINL